jgi:hypothetical protein
MEILIGYEIKTAKPVKIKQSHLIVTGITQLSGKTTTLETLIKRSGCKAIVFKTKIGERSFAEGTETVPFFRDRSDYDFVKSLIEAYAREKLFIEKGTLMRLCKGSCSLVEIKKRVDDVLAEGKLKGLKEEIHTRLQHYLENLIPQIQYSNLSRVLHIYDGLNIMNLERFTEPAQSLIIQSVAEEVLANMRGVILVIPEAWKFIPQKYNNPCKRSVESFIRQGATNENYVWIDSQDMSGVDKIPLKQISTWILGYQSERNEVKHTLDQIALPARLKPKVDEIMKLKKGHFIISSYEGVKKVYVQPHWLDKETAMKIAKGQRSVDELHHQPSLVSNSIPVIGKAKKDIESPAKMTFMQSKELVELRMDFFNKISELHQIINGLANQYNELKLSLPSIDINEIVSLVIQKMPVQPVMTLESKPIQVDENLIKEIIRRIPAGNNITYEVAPLEKIKKDFIAEAKNKIIVDIKTLDEEQKKIVKFVETQNKGCHQTMILSKCLFVSATSGGTRSRISQKCKDMANLFLVRMDKNAIVYPNLKGRLQELFGLHEASADEIEIAYNHIINDLI